MAPRPSHTRQLHKKNQEKERELHSTAHSSVYNCIYFYKGKLLTDNPIVQSLACPPPSGGFRQHHTPGLTLMLEKTHCPHYSLYRRLVHRSYMIDVSFFFGYSLFFSVSISVSLSLSLDAKSTSLEVSVRLGYALARHPNLLDAIWRLIWFPRVLALYIFISLQLMVPFTLGPFFSFLVGERGCYCYPGWCRCFFPYVYYSHESIS
jgi:hypothetical protein